jgi:SecD/SecF fusion protein
MLKTGIFIAILFVLLLNSCNRNAGKTEIKIQLSEAECLYSMSSFTDSAFTAAYQFARENYNPEKEEFISLFEKKLTVINPDARLAAYYNTFELKDKINFNSTNDQVVNVLKDEIKLAGDYTIQVLKKRLEAAFKTSSFLTDFFYKPVVTVTELPGKNMFSFKVNKKVDNIRITKLLQSQMDIGFWETYSLSEIWDFIAGANKLIKETLNTGKKVQTLSVENESLINTEDNSLFSILIPADFLDSTQSEGDVIGISRVTDTSMVNRYLAMPELKSSFPRQLKLMWEIKPMAENKDFIRLIAIKISSRDGSARLNAIHIIEAEAVESNNLAAVRFNMDSEGAKRWSRMTQENIGRQIAIVINNAVYSNPLVLMQIEEGKAEIKGNLTTEEAIDLASLINAGIMPKISVKVISINEEI